MTATAEIERLADPVIAIRLDPGVLARIDRVVAGMRRTIAGAQATRRTVIEPVLRGACTLGELESKYGANDAPRRRQQG